MEETNIKTCWAEGDEASEVPPNPDEPAMPKKLVESITEMIGGLKQEQAAEVKEEKENEEPIISSDQQVNRETLQQKLRRKLSKRDHTTDSQSTQLAANLSPVNKSSRARLNLPPSPRRPVHKRAIDIEGEAIEVNIEQTKDLLDNKSQAKANWRRKIFAKKKIENEKGDGDAKQSKHRSKLLRVSLRKSSKSRRQSRRRKNLSTLERVREERNEEIHSKKSSDGLEVVGDDDGNDLKVSDIPDPPEEYANDDEQEQCGGIICGFGRNYCEPRGRSRAASSNNSFAKTEC